MDEHNIVYSRKKNLHRDSNNRQHKPIFLIDFHSFYWHVETIGAKKKPDGENWRQQKNNNMKFIVLLYWIECWKIRLVSSLSEIGGLIFYIELILDCQFYQQFERIHKGKRINLKSDFGYWCGIFDYSFEVMILSVFQSTIVL